MPSVTVSYSIHYSGVSDVQTVVDSKLHRSCQHVSSYLSHYSNLHQ